MIVVYIKGCCNASGSFERNGLYFGLDDGMFAFLNILFIVVLFDVNFLL